MPIYVYRCSRGHEVERLQSVDERDEPLCCNARHGVYVPALGTETTTCNQLMDRVMAAPASHFPGADSWRKK